MTQSPSTFIQANFAKSAIATSAMPQAYTDLHSLQNIRANGDDELALRKVAKQFESMFVGMLFKNMRQANAVFEKGNFGHSNAEKMYRDMYDQQLSIHIAEGRGLGIADMVYRQLKGPDHSHTKADLTANQEQPLRQLNTLPHHAVQRELTTDKQEFTIDTQKITDKKTSQLLSVSKTITPVSENHQFDNSSPEGFVQSLLAPVKTAAKALGLDPLMMIAQAALETGWGKHVIKDSQGKSSYNLFNIKADNRWQGPKVTTQTLEFREGIAVKESAKFRRYDSIQQSIEDYLAFLQANPRYQNALQLAKDSQAFIRELHDAGYATDPEYTTKVQKVYEHIQGVIHNTHKKSPIEENTLGNSIPQSEGRRS